MPRINLNGASTVIAGRSGAGVFDATRYGLTHATDDSKADVNTTALQDAIDDMTAWRTSRICGATLLIPPGRYVFNGGITFPSVNAFPINIIATGARFRFPSSGTVGQNTAMFSTPMPTSNNDAEVQNDLRNLWRWTGGDFDARNKSGSTIFDWNAASRMMFRDVHLGNVTTGIRARFCLHLRIQDSALTNVYNYGVHIEEDNDWPGGGPANAAGHGAIIDNCRFYLANGTLAGVKVAHCEFIVRDSTFEGGNPVTNIDFENGNTSCISSSVQNLHLENDPTDSHVRINSLHGFDVDINHVVSGVRINAVAATIVNVHRLGYPSTGAGDGASINPILKTAANVRWRFLEGAGSYGGGAVMHPNMWQDGVVPRVVGLLYGGSNNDGKGARLYLGAKALNVGSDGKLYIDDGAGGSATVVGTQS